ncbi:MAG: hypothetical protein B7733_14260 [Myxococcales bacterium FL481]|nr:MAG: hypothetical protein B7733_14260 [Myxococcales bacterium FL481]
MPDQQPVDNPTESGRPSLWRRVRPFLRRDRSARLASAALAFVVIVGLSWLGVSALTRVDNDAAHSLRVHLGLETPGAVCGGGGTQPACAYDDVEQARAEAQHAQERRVRIAVLQQLRVRLDTQLALLDAASTRTRRMAAGSRDDLLQPVDLRPAVTREFNRASRSRIRRALGRGDDRQLARAIAHRRRLIRDASSVVDRLLARDNAGPVSPIPASGVGSSARVDLLAHVEDRRAATRLHLWLTAEAGEPTGTVLDELTPSDAAALATAISDPDAPLWHSGFSNPAARSQAIRVPSVRYRSPIDDQTHWRLVGVAVWGFASLLLLVAGPVTTAAQTANERQAGTLPVLRMTGLSTRDLAWAMAIGPNLFTWAAGGALLVVGSAILAITVGWAALGLPLVLLALAMATTYPLAIGFGDALGTRLSPLVVGGLLAGGLAAGGLVGGLLVSLDAAGLGFFLGPLPAVLGAIAPVTGIEGFTWAPSGPYAPTSTWALLYGLFLQFAMAVACLRLWSRRVERPWEPLLSPVEGVSLALASLGASLIVLFDIAARSEASSLAQLNGATFVASALLLPTLGWLFAVSLRRPARANAVADHVATRWAFARFQAVLAVAATTLTLAYGALMQSIDLSPRGAEVMWGTLAQTLLLAETAVGLLLCAARRRRGKLRVALFGGLLVLLQAIAVVVVYELETTSALHWGTEGSLAALSEATSPYWLVFLALLWGTGLAVVMTALLRKRDRQRAEAKERERSVDPDDDGMPGRRLIH